MPPRRGRGPTTFSEWMVGTSIASAAGPKKKSSRRDIFRLEMTTDDEAEEDTLKISYPRTGRTGRKKHVESPPVKQIEPAIKEVRFDDSTESEPAPAPTKSALKKKTKVTTIETEEDIPEVDASSDASKSPKEAKSSEEETKSVKCKKKHAKPKDADTDSDCATNPHPTCTCLRCSIAREFIVREFLKTTSKKKSSAPDTDTAASESEAKTPPKPKNQQSNKSKKKQDTTTEAEASESEPEVPAKAKGQVPNKSNLKAKKVDNDTDTEASQSEAEIPPNAPRKKFVSFQKLGSDSESAKESDGESTQSLKKKKKAGNSQAESNKNKNKPGSQPQKGGKKSKKIIEVSSSEYTSEGESSSEDEVERAKRNKKSKQRRKQESDFESEFETRKSRNSRRYRHADYQEDNDPRPRLQRPHFVEPIRASVVQEERVIESPIDPPPNSYFDPQHNVLRIYNGPMYGHHGQYLYPPHRNGSHHPMPMGMPHPSNNPYWHKYKNDQPPQYTGLNNPQILKAAQAAQDQKRQHQIQEEYEEQRRQQQQQPQQSQQQQNPDYNNRPHPPGAYDYVMPGQAYNQVPITQSMPAPGYVPGIPWNTNVCQDPAWLPGHYQSGPQYGPPPNPWEQTRYHEKDIAADPAKGPPSSKDRNKDGENNVIPDGMKDPKNPYVPNSKKSAFSVWGPDVNVTPARSNGSKANTNGMNNNGDGWNTAAPGDTWDNQAPAGGEWGATNSQQGNRKSSHGTVKSQRPDAWGTTGEWDRNSKKSGKKSDKGSRTYPSYPASNNNNNNHDTWASGANGLGNNQNNGSKSNNGGGSNSNNVMPGTWVDTPNMPVPAWGDLTAAADTHGQATNW